MQHEELLRHYDDLARLAASRCSRQADAEDLVADTMLAALEYMHRGGVIEHPRTWLANTLMHKHNSALRLAYRMPVVVNYDTLTMAGEDEPLEDAVCKAGEDEAAELRREVLYLAKMTREVLLRHYFAGESVAAIAEALDIPVGTVKSRLAAGRAQIRKGMESMEQKKNPIPAKLEINWGGSLGRNGAPVSLVEGDLIAQNLLILAYPKPLTTPELAQAIGIPTVYIEPILARLADGELMVCTENQRYYTDFILYTPKDRFAPFAAQLDFVSTNFDALWAPLGALEKKLAALNFTASYSPQKRQKLARYAVIRAVQKFVLSRFDRTQLDYPRRRDGGQWSAVGFVHPGDQMPSYPRIDEFDNYTFGGERTSGGACDYKGARCLRLHEFDTTLYDCPNRPHIAGWETYFSSIHKLLWCICRGINPETADLPDALIETIPRYIEAGMLARNDGGALTVDIPVLTRAEYAAVAALSEDAAGILSTTLGDALNAFMHSFAVRLPPHLTSVPEFRRYEPAVACIEMAVVREAWSRGVHMQGVEYCCPPVVLEAE